MVQGLLWALRQPLTLSGPLASPSYIYGLGIKAAAFGGEEGERWGRGQEGEGHVWSRRGFWSRLASPAPPRPCPYLLSHPEQGRCHVRQRAQAHTWSTPEPQQGQGCRTVRQRDLGGEAGRGLCPTRPQHCSPATESPNKLWEINYSLHSPEDPVTHESHGGRRNPKRWLISASCGCLRA